MINRVGVRLLLANKPDIALDYFSKVQLVSQDRRLNGTVLHNIGRANMLKGNYKVALQYLNESAAIQKETDGKIMDKTLSYIKECKDKI
jgi:ATP/maltotriose-dependent transcriptional regulator MalT